jgi:hypothetical protein
MRSGRTARSGISPRRSLPPGSLIFRSGLGPSLQIRLRQHMNNGLSLLLAHEVGAGHLWPARRRIAGAPADCSYRVYVGANQSDCPKELCAEDGLLLWDYYDPGMYRHWAYPFAVDCTFYSVAFLRRFLGQLLYHNPISLEDLGVRAVRRRALLRSGMSPHTSTAVSLPLNKVDFTYSDNTHGDVSLECLRDAYLDGFRLEYDLSAAATTSVYVPDRWWLCRGAERREIRVG